ncbi:unnamed protein product [Hapterophycus canaliculatus]
MAETLMFGLPRPPFPPPHVELTGIHAFASLSCGVGGCCLCVHSACSRAIDCCIEETGMPSETPYRHLVKVCTGRAAHKNQLKASQFVLKGNTNSQGPGCWVCSV